MTEQAKFDVASTGPDSGSGGDLFVVQNEPLSLLAVAGKQVDTASKEPYSGEVFKVAGASNLTLNTGELLAIGSEPVGAISTHNDDYGKLGTAEKVMDISASILSSAPKHYYEELSHRITHEPVQVAKNVAIGTGIGFGAVGLVRRFPRAGKAALGVLLAAQATSYGWRTWNFLSEASGAKNSFERDQYVNLGAQSLAGEAVTVTEMLPGAIAGGFVAGRTNLIPAAESFARRTYAFHGPGSHKLPEGILNKDGTINIFRLDAHARSLEAANPSVTRESARIFDLAKGRVSGRINGSKNSDHVNIGFGERDGYFTVHRHPVKTSDGVLKPGESMLESTNVSQTLADQLYTRGTGMIQIGRQTTVYPGKGVHAESLRSQGIDPSKAYFPKEGLTYDFLTVGTKEFAPQVFRSHSLGIAGDEAIIFNAVEPVKAFQVAKHFDVGMPSQMLSSLSTKAK